MSDLITDFVSKIADTIIPDLVKGLPQYATTITGALPFGEIAKKMVEDYIDESDPDKASRRLIIHTYFATYLSAIAPIKWRSLFPQDKREIIGIAKYNLSSANEFSIESFDQSEIFQELTQATHQLLANLNFSETDINQIENYIKTYFRTNYYKILIDHPHVYRSFSNYLKDVSPSARFTYLLCLYRNKLRGYYDDSILPEESTISLKQIYVEPDFEIHKFSFIEDKFISTNEWVRSDLNQLIPLIKGGVKRQRLSKGSDSKDLHQFIKFWYEDRRIIDDINDSRFMLILGQPGQGKTSFCKRLLNDLLEDNENSNVCFIRLRDIDNPVLLLDDPLKVIYEFVNQSIVGLERDLKLSETDFSQCLLILDGLDELKLKQMFTVQDIDKFCSTLLDKLMKKNTDYPTMKIIVTSRINYLNLEKIRLYKPVIVKISPLTVTQQIRWVNNYAQFDNSIVLNESLVNELQNVMHIRELLEQPVLLHMVATAGLDIQKAENKIALYSNLFDVLIERKYAKETSNIPTQIDVLNELPRKKREFRKFIGTVAFHIYQSENLCINRDALLQLIKDHRFNELLGKEHELKDSITGLMIAFYFQQKSDGSTSSENFAIEFYHNSLMEFLVAEYIFESLIDLTELNRHGEWMHDPEIVCKKLFGLFADKLLSWEVSDNIKMLFNLQDTYENQGTDRLQIQNALYSQLIRSMPYLMERQMIPSGENTTQLINKGLKAFGGMLTIFSCLIKKINNKDFTPDNFKDILRMASLYSSLIAPANLTDITISEMDFKDWNLQFINFSGATFIKVNFRRVNLSFTNLSLTNLTEVNLIEANLTAAFLGNASLSDVNLSNANLTEADFANADFANTNLREANLLNADFSETNLSKVNLREANLINTDFMRADLSEVDMKAANLTGASLIEAKLVSANLTQATLIGTNLTMANLTGSKLNNAILFKATLIGTILTGVDITRSIIRKTYFLEADLRETKMTAIQKRYAQAQKAIL